MVVVQEVVITDLARRGTGKDTFSPIRNLLEVYSKQGALLAVHDSLGNYAQEDMIAFGGLCRQQARSSIEEVFEQWKTR